MKKAVQVVIINFLIIFLLCGCGKMQAVVDIKDNLNFKVYTSIKLSDLVNINDEVFFYDVSNGEVTINLGVVTKKDKINDTETTFTINGSHELSSSMLIGKCSDAKIYSKLGAILRVLESKFGYLLIVILPTLILFLYEIYRVIIEIKTPVTVKEE